MEAARRHLPQTAERAIFVGDVHGCAEELVALLDAVGYRRGRDRLLLTGDAFSRGPFPRRVWELILENGAEMVLGNHDDRLLRQVRAQRAGEEVRFRRDDHRRTFEALRPVFGDLHPWLEAVPLAVDEPTFLLVHAGIHPEKGLPGTSRDEFLAIRLWPPAGGLQGPRWHDAVAPLDGRVLVFGHDAPGGLVIKRRQPARAGPWLVGLDTGCVYGGRLSAYVLDEDRVVQVESRQDGSALAD